MARGFTLIETLVVMFILGIIASVALPELSNSDSYKLDRAAEELAMGFRFTRDESVRTGEPHTFQFWSLTTPAYKIFKLNLADTTDQSQMLYHPVSKQQYFFQFGQEMGGVSITNPAWPFFYHKNAGYQGPSVIFDKEGKPFLTDGTTYSLFHHGQVDLEYRGLTKSVLLEAGGRVSIQ